MFWPSERDDSDSIKKADMDLVCQKEVKELAKTTVLFWKTEEDRQADWEAWDILTDIDGSVVFIDSVASCYMNASLGGGGVGGCRVLSNGAGGEGSPFGSAVAGSVCSPGCCESPRTGQHVISSPSTGQVGSHFGHILFHNVSFPILVFFS